MSIPSGWRTGFSACSVETGQQSDQRPSLRVAVCELTFGGLRLDTRVAKYPMIWLGE